MGDELRNWDDPLPLESLASFLERLRQLNGEEKSWLKTLSHPIVRQHPNLLRAQKDYQFLAGLTGVVEIEKLYSLSLHRFVPAYYLFEAWPIWPQEYDDLSAPLWEIGGLDRFVHGQESGKVCPLCWRDQSAFLLPWSLRHITTCPIHQVFLVDRCTMCGNQLGALQSQGTCGNCGYMLDDLSTDEMEETEEQVELIDLLWSAIGCSDIPFPQSYPTLASNHPLRQMEPAALMQFLWYAGQFVLNRDPENPLFTWKQTQREKRGRETGYQLLKQTDVQTVHTVLLAMWRLLKGWPQSWYQLLDRLVGQEEPLEATPATCIPAVLKELFPGDAFIWIHHGWEDFMWQSHNHFIQLATWQRYWEATPRETRIKQPKAKPQRAITRIILPPSEKPKLSQSKVS